MGHESKMGLWGTPLVTFLEARCLHDNMLWTVCPKWSCSVKNHAQSQYVRYRFFQNLLAPFHYYQNICSRHLRVLVFAVPRPSNPNDGPWPLAT